jgi:hypothetical protein
MSILWCGGEEIDFDGWPGFNNSSETYGYSLSYARGLVYGSGDWCRSKIGGMSAITSGWLHFRLAAQAYYVSTRIVGFAATGETTSKKGLYVSCSAAYTSRVSITKFDGSTHTVLVTETGNTFVPGRMITLHLENYGAGDSSERITAYSNGVEVCTYQGDLTISGVDDFDGIVLGCNGSINGGSEFIVADEDPRTMHVVTMYPAAAGSANAWTGAYTDIDEVAISGTDVLYTNANGNAAQFNTTTIPSGVFTIKAVKAIAYAAKSSDSTPGTLKLGVRTSSTDVDAGQTVGTMWENYERLMLTNPTTSSPWLDTEMATLQIAFESAA